MFGTEIALPKGLADFCAAREDAIQKMAATLATIQDVNDLLEQVGNYLVPTDFNIRSTISDLTRDLDKRLWREAFDHTGFMQLMDREEKQKFMNDVERAPPPFTMENIRSTFLSVAQRADEMFARGVVNVFRRLSDDHKSNTDEPFKINHRAIICGMVQRNWRQPTVLVNYHSWASEQLNDIDRVIKVVDGKKHTPRELEIACNRAFDDRSTNNTYSDDYYLIRGYLNGNMHITFKRDDLLEKINRIIGEYYHGTALAARKRA